MSKHVVVRFRVKNYETWKKAFDKNIESCQEHGGMKSGGVYRDIGDPLELWVAFEVSDLNQVREYMQSKGNSDRMREAGVIGEPSIFFLEKTAEVPELVGVGSSRSSSEEIPSVD